jgi:uncharacterized membrane protein YvbJ
MFCPSCGKQNRDNVLFCAHCGKALPQQSSPILQRAPIPQSSPSPQTKSAPKFRISNTTKKALITGILIVGLIIVVLLIYYPGILT